MDLLAWDMLICLGLAVGTCCYFWQAVQGWFALLAIAPNKNLLSVEFGSTSWRCYRYHASTSCIRYDKGIAVWKLNMIFTQCWWMGDIVRNRSPQFTCICCAPRPPGATMQTWGNPAFEDGEPLLPEHSHDTAAELVPAFGGT